LATLDDFRFAANDAAVLKLFPLSPKSRRWAFIALLAMVVAGALFSLRIGALDLGWGSIMKSLLGIEDDTMAATAVNTIRLPRTLLALLAGATIASVGCALQGLFRNPLADPGLIGVSAGGAVGAAFVLGPGALLLAALPLVFGIYAMMIGAALGSIGAMALLYVLSRTPSGPSIPAMLLCGIALNTFAGALIGLFIYLAEAERIRDLAFWTLGSLSRAPRESVLAAVPLLVIAIWWILSQARALNAVLLGEDEARLLGVDTGRLKRKIFIACGLGMGTAVALTGTIGFVGLVVPHICRIIFGTDHRFLLPASALFGAVLLVVTDSASRLLLGSAELPIGIITALLGAPFFLALLVYERQRLHLPV
jgi:iron complex transport system permease protein